MSVVTQSGLLKAVFIVAILALLKRLVFGDADQRHAEAVEWNVGVHQFEFS